MGDLGVLRILYIVINVGVNVHYTAMRQLKITNSHMYHAEALNRNREG